MNSAQNHLRLGVNIDHVATIRNARGGLHPDPLRAAIIAEKAGADGITAHLREDRRHISDTDIKILKENISLPLNLEMAATSEMLEIALRTKPNACCIVPEKRQEITTEGGLDVVAQESDLKAFVTALKAAGIRVSMFVNADKEQISASSRIGADIIEIHTGKYCELEDHARRNELTKILLSSQFASRIGLEVHAGHGLSYDSVGAIAAISEIVELNIGHFLIGEAIYIGLEASITKMRRMMDEARMQAGTWE